MAQVMQAEEPQAMVYQVESPGAQPDVVRVIFAEGVRLLRGDRGDCLALTNPLGVSLRIDADPVLVRLIQRLGDFAPDIKAIAIEDYHVLELRVRVNAWRDALAEHLRELVPSSD